MLNDNGHYGEGTAAGYKGNSAETLANGREAAANVDRTLARRHRQMLDIWATYGATGAIPEEIAADLGLPVHLVRPRAGELVKLGKLHQIGRRLGDLGSRVTVYSVERPQAPEVAA